MKNFQTDIHVWGRVWMLSALAVMVAVPVAISIRFGAWPGFMPVFRGLLAVAVGILKVIRDAVIADPHLALVNYVIVG